MVLLPPQTPLYIDAYNIATFYFLTMYQLLDCWIDCAPETPPSTYRISFKSPIYGRPLFRDGHKLSTDDNNNRAGVNEKATRTRMIR